MKHTAFVFLGIFSATLLNLSKLYAQERATVNLIDAASMNDIERVWKHDQSIEQISEHVYRWGSDRQFGAYILTDEGIIVIDGHYCDSGTVDWLKAELDKRYDVPIKYVILSHDHIDHTCRSNEYSETATVIGHTNILPHMIDENRTSAIPDFTFDQEMLVRLGGVTLKLMYLGPTHSDNLIQIHIPEEGVLIAIDSAKGKNLFPDFRDMDVNNQLKAMRTLGNLEDVEVVLPGHGPVTTQAAFMEYHAYVLALKNDILQHMRAGKTLAEIKVLSEVTMRESFSDYRGIDDFIEHNIVTMWDYLYRYREPNISIKHHEATRCIEDSTDCRTH